MKRFSTLILCFFLVAAITTQSQALYCYQDCKVAPLGSSCYVSTPMGPKCICPYSDFEVNGNCVSRGKLSPSAGCGTCPEGASCVRTISMTMCLCDPGLYESNGVCYSVATNQPVGATTVPPTTKAPTVAPTFTPRTEEPVSCKSQCDSKFPASRCITQDAQGKSVCVCPSSSIRTSSGSCQPRSDYEVSFDPRCPRCTPNSQCHIYLRRFWCVCNPGFFSANGACNPIIPIATTKAPTTQAPTKAPAKCTLPELPKNVVKSDKSVFTEGETHILECSKGYAFAGNPIIVCTSEGTFTPVYGICTPVTCQLPTLPDDFAVPVQKFYTNGQTVELKCKDNLNLVGDPTIVCKADGTFEEISASCKPVTCTLPENMPLHVLQPAKRTYAVGDQVALQCSPEFDQSGATFTVCEADGQFSVIDTVCKLKVVYGDWKLGKCSVTCGQGTRIDVRTCVQGFCIEGLIRAEFCELPACAVYSDWQGTCSVTCGKGTQTETRTCLEGDCNGDLTRTIPCQGDICAEYGEWEIGTCSVDCGSGTRIDIRACLQGKCAANLLVRSIPCEQEACVIYGEWVAGECSVTCGSGVSTHTRDCVLGKCTESLMKTVPCEREVCEVYGDWVIGECSVACGSGVRTDTRACVQGNCRETLIRTVACEQEACVVYGDWEVGTCSVTCGKGVRIDLRKCLRGFCTEDLDRQVPCEQEECVVYSDWQVGTCGVTCGQGFRVDKRFCIQGACTGDLERSVPCQGEVCTEYGDWQIGTCNVECGEGERIDIRDCLSGLCSEDLVRTVPCKQKECELYGDWVIGECSAACGSGVRIDIRACLLGYCTEDLARTVPCEGQNCNLQG